ncbi:MAG: DUF2079 domain-containing protein [Deltaproteobacteria bacterium]|nr:DUF2079 domain-containing protein [Deltaproteobacteria bacterium]
MERENAGEPSAAPRLWPQARPWVCAAGLLLLLVPTAYALALARQWLYFPWHEIEAGLRAGPFRGYGRVPLLRETGTLTLELLALAALVAWALRTRGRTWARALGDAALHLLPLLAAPTLLFLDNGTARIQLHAALVAGVAGGLAFAVLPEAGAMRRWRRLPRRLALVAVLTAGAYYAWLAWLQHAAYWSSLYDLGLFAGSLRSTLHGDGILFSPQFGNTFLAEHFSPILLLLTPLYALYQDPLTLQLVMAASMAGTGWLLFRLAEETLDDAWLGLAFAVAWLLLPATLQAQWHGFKMDLLEPPLVVGAVLAARRGSGRWFLLCIALLWATKEDACVATAVLGLWAWLAHGFRRLGPAVIVLSAAYGVVVMGWVLPAYTMFQEPGTFYGGFDPEHYKFARHFSHLGPTLGSAMLRALLNPLYVLGYLFSEDRLGSVLKLLAPLGFLGLWGGWVNLLLFVPALEMLLASFNFMYQLDIYYACVPMALAFPAAIFGLARLRRRLAARPRLRDRLPPERLRAAVAGYLVAAVLMLDGTDPHFPESSVWMRPQNLRTPRTELLDELLAEIPPDVPVSATGYQAIHLMNRSRPAMLPFGMEHAPYLVIDLMRPAFPFPGKLATMVPFARKLLEQPEWGVVRAERGAILLRRGAPRDRNAAAAAMLDNPDLEAEDFETSHFPNLAVGDPTCSNGAALRIGPEDRRGAGKLFFGPHWSFGPGRYRATFRLAAAREPHDTLGGLVATIDVHSEPGTLVVRDLRFSDFARPDAWQEFPLDFVVDRPLLPLEFRVHYHDAGTLALDLIRIRRLP